MSEVNGNPGHDEAVGDGMQNGHDRAKDEEIEDPEILAAIAASQNEAGSDADDEILAAIEASKKEAEFGSENNSNDGSCNSENQNVEINMSNKNLETKKESSGPTVILNTMFSNEMEAAEKSQDGEEEAEEERTDSKDGENNEKVKDVPAESADDQIALDGEPEIGENPFEMSVDDSGNPLGEGSDFDPLNGNGDGEDNEGDSGFIDKVNSGGIGSETKKPIKKKRANPVYITPVNKRKRSFSGDSSEEEDEDEYIPGAKKAKKTKKKPTSSRPKRTPKPAEVTFKCTICSFTSDTLGELMVHKQGNHKNQAKPSYLDMGEAAIMTLDNKSGSSKSTILKYILSEHSTVISEDSKKAGKLLGVALEAGIVLGRLRQGTLGRKNAEHYWVVSKTERRKVLELWKKNKRAVEHKDGGSPAGDIVEDSEEFMAIKEKLTKYNIQVTTAPKDSSSDTKNYGRGKRTSKPVSKGAALSMKDDSDDEICVLEEKITPKTKQKILQRKKLLAKGGSVKTVIRVNSSQGKQMLKKIAASGLVSSAMNPFSASNMEDEEDEQLTCPVCLSSFWYPNQTSEHMKSVHNIENPEKHIEDKRAKV